MYSPLNLFSGFAGELYGRTYNREKRNELLSLISLFGDYNLAERLVLELNREITPYRENVNFRVDQVKKEGDNYRLTTGLKILPSVIFANRTYFLEGSVFYNRIRPDGGTDIYFVQHPQALFASTSFSVLAGRPTRDDHRSSWALPCPSKTDPAAVLEYLRGYPGEMTFKKACASVAGVFCAPKDITVAGVNTNKALLSTGDVCDVDNLTYGTTITEGTIPGKELDVLFPVDIPGYWWRTHNTSFPQGLSLNSLTHLPFEGTLLIPDRPVTFWIESGNHVRFELDGSDTDADIFFNNMWAKEDLSGQYLKDILGMDSDISTNPIDVVFKTLLSSRAVILKTTPHKIPEFRNLLTFVHDYTPVGMIPLMVINDGIAALSGSAQRLYFFDPATNSWQAALFADFD